MKKLGLSHRPTFRKNYLQPALEAGLIERTLPDKPNSSLQRYRLRSKHSSSLAMPGLVKIGFTDSLEDRLKSLSVHSGMPLPFGMLSPAGVDEAQFTSV